MYLFNNKGNKIKRIILLLMAFSISFSSLFAEVTANDILNKNAQRWDITFSDTDNGDVNNIETMLQEVNKVAKEIDKISVLLPRATLIGSCSGGIGCNLDSVQCDAVTEAPFCPDGSVLNTTRDMCQKDPDVFDCPVGFTYDTMVGQCVKLVDCPYGGTYVVERQRCESPIIYDCPAGYTLTEGICVSPPLCEAGATFNSTTNKCEIEAIKICDGSENGWLYDKGNNVCYKTPDCQSGFSYNTTFKKCVKSYTPTCKDGYTYNLGRDRCEKVPSCPSGTTYNTLTNRCEQGVNSACSGGSWNGSQCLYVVNKVLVSYTVTHSFDCSPSVVNFSGAGRGPLPANLAYGENGDIATAWGRCHDWDNRNIYGRFQCTNGNWIYKDGGSSGYYAPIPSEYTGSASSSKASYRVDKKNDGICGKNWEGWFTYINGGYNVAEVKGTISQYVCPHGSTEKNSICETFSSTSCPANYTHNGSGRCQINPTCPSGGLFDGTADKCYLTFIKSCPTGAYDNTSDMCVLNANCDGGTLNTTKNLCEKPYEIICPVGVEDLSTEKCTFDPTCTDSGSLDPTLSTCKDDKIPLSCAQKTDIALDVCYEKENECKIDTSFANYASLVYSDALKACLVDENAVCASSLTWSEAIIKCEAVPICNYGVYNFQNNFCFADDYSCPINPSLECKGTEQFNRWCSPWECNSNNQCGYAFCSNNQTPKNTSPWMLRSLLGDVAYISNSQCIGANCDIVTNRDISYCGEDSCPKGFDVYEQDNKCYQDVCPDGAFLGQDNNCYIEE